MGAAGLVVAALLLFHSGGAVQLPLLVVVVPVVLLLAGLLFLTYRMFRYRQVLTAMHANMLDAQEGTLQPVDVGALRDPYLRQFVGDYNLMMSALRRVFSTVEECQNRVLTELQPSPTPSIRAPQSGQAPSRMQLTRTWNPYRSMSRTPQR